MFLTHFGNNGLGEVLKWKLKKIHFWHNEAVLVHNKLNSPSKEED